MEVSWYRQEIENRIAKIEAVKQSYGNNLQPMQQKLHDLREEIKGLFEKAEKDPDVLRGVFEIHGLYALVSKAVNLDDEPLAVGSE